MLRSSDFVFLGAYVSALQGSFAFYRSGDFPPWVLEYVDRLNDFFLSGAGDLMPGVSDED